MVAVMKNWFVRLGGLLLLGVMGMPAVATEIGDPAPRLAITDWLVGEQVSIEPGGTNVYVIDFWGSWNPISGTTMQRVQTLHQSFHKVGLVVVGVTNEKVEAARRYLDTKGKSVSYRIGVDAGSATTRSYLEQFGVKTLPHSFVVDRSGKVIWHGHPLRGLGDVTLKALFRKLRPDETWNIRKRYGGATNYLAKARSGEKGLVLSGLGKRVVREFKNNLEFHNQFAWTLLTDERIEHRDLELAVMAAKRAYELSEGKNPAILDTYARALFSTGKTLEAIEFQEKAVEMATSDPLKRQLLVTLKGYRERIRQ